MLLGQLVKGLTQPNAIYGRFSACIIDNYPGVRVGIDFSGCPGVFFEISTCNRQRRRFALAEVMYTPEATCRFDESEERRCAILQCTATDEASRDLFLRVVESWLPTVPRTGIGSDIDEAVSYLFDLFDALDRPGSGEVLGLWGELFVILAADEPHELLHAWHWDPFELHDFVSGNTRLEIKAATGARRHHFSLEQLQSPIGVSLVVGSMVTKRSARGLSVNDLCARLHQRIKDPRLIFRIDRTAALTLGDHWTETATHRYDVSMAASSLAFYNGAIVPRVNPNLPPEVRDVRFVVEFDGLPTLATPFTFPGLGSLSGLQTECRT